MFLQSRRYNKGSDLDIILTDQLAVFYLIETNIYFACFIENYFMKRKILIIGLCAGMALAACKGNSKGTLGTDSTGTATDSSKTIGAGTAGTDSNMTTGTPATQGVGNGTNGTGTGSNGSGTGINGTSAGGNGPDKGNTKP